MIKMLITLTPFLIIFGSCQSFKVKKISEFVKFENMEWVDSVGSKTFPEGKKEYHVNDFGAVGDGKTINTRAIQNAINTCAANGGGKVVFDPGKYLTGSLFLKKGVNLNIGENVIILGSQDIKDYPEIYTRVAGIEMKWPAALINIIDQENSAISGKGKINAQGKPFWDLYWKMRKEQYEPNGLRWIVDYDCKRPRTVLVSESKNITIENISIMQAGFWSIHILYSEYVTVDGVIIRNNIDGKGPSTDGIDIDSSEKILIQNCDTECNDDNYCIKSGRDNDGLRVNRPARFVVIKDCISHSGGGFISLGSETSGGISHILAMNMKAVSSSSGIRFKSAKTRGGIIENIYFQDIKMDSVLIPIYVSLNWNPKYSYSKLPDGYLYDSIPEHWKTMLEKVEPPEKGIPVLKNVFIKDVFSNNSEFTIIAEGYPESFLLNFNLENIELNAKKPGRIEFAKNWNLKNVTIKTMNNKKIIMRSTEDIQWK